MITPSGPPPEPTQGQCCRIPTAPSKRERERASEGSCSRILSAYPFVCAKGKGLANRVSNDGAKGCAKRVNNGCAAPTSPSEPSQQWLCCANDTVKSTTRVWWRGAVPASCRRTPLSAHHQQRGLLTTYWCKGVRQPSQQWLCCMNRTTTRADGEREATGCEPLRTVMMASYQQHHQDHHPSVVAGSWVRILLAYPFVCSPASSVSSDHLAPIQGYLAHKKQPPPPGLP